MVTHIKPNNWDHFKLGDIAEEVRSLYEPQKDIILPYIGLEHIQQNTLTLKGIGKSSETISTKKSFNAGQILFGSLRPYFRKVIRPKFSGVCSTDITVIRAKPQFDTGFLYYFIASQEFIDYATNVSSGTRMPRANWKVLSEKEWCFPKLNIQKKIASILSAYDDLIENNLRRIRILEEMAQNLYREWFVNFRFPGYENTRFIDSPLGQIPEGWEIKELIDFGKIVTGKTPSKSKPEYYGTDMPFIKLPDMHNVIFCIKTLENLSKGGADTQKSKTIPPNNLCVSCIGTVGKVVITADFSQTNQQINSIVLDKDEHLEYLYFTLLGMRHKIEAYSATGATMNNLSRGKFISLKILCPPNRLIDTYHGLVSSLFRLILNLQLMNGLLKQTRDLLLPKLISGEVDVSELDINVPEEVAI